MEIVIVTENIAPSKMKHPVASVRGTWRAFSFVARGDTETNMREDIENPSSNQF